MDICNYKKLSNEDIIKILDEEKLCYLSTTDTTNIEAVPMWYVFDYSDRDLVFYFISDSSGQKMDNMYYTGIAGITLLQHYTCRRKNFYKTIMANGSTVIINDIKEKLAIVEKFQNKYGCKENFFCDSSSNIAFVKVNVSEITGRYYS